MVIPLAPASPVKASKSRQIVLKRPDDLFDFQAGCAAPQRRLKKALPGFIELCWQQPAVALKILSTR
jgi:hypothetical protein